MITTKKGDVWVSAILYFGLGIIVLTIILSAGTPIVNRLRDKNIVLQTKDVMHVLDENLREVAREGPGSQRPLTIDIRKGEFKIDQATDTIEWTYRTKAILSEPCTPQVENGRAGDANNDGADDDCNPNIIEEGTLKLLTRGVQGDYTVRLWLHYDQVYLILPELGGVNPSLVGRTDLVLRNGGPYCIDNQNTKKSLSDTPAPTCFPNTNQKIGIILTTQR